MVTVCHGMPLKMLHTLAGTLTDIQQKMRMRVLGPMYRSKMEASFQVSTPVLT